MSIFSSAGEVARRFVVDHHPNKGPNGATVKQLTVLES